MTKTRRRIFNYRPMCFVALALLLGIILAEAIYGEDAWFIAVPISLAVVAFVVLMIIPATRKLFYLPLAMLVGFASMTISSAVYDSRIKYTEYSQIMDMTATVSSMIIVDGDSSQFYVDELYIDGEKANFGGRALVYFSFVPDFNAGDVIYMRGYVQGTGHKKFDDDFAQAISSRNAYRLYISKIEKLSEGELQFPKSLQHELKQTFYDNLDSDDAAICSALIMGDKFGMSEDLKYGVQSAGLAHILAVSGLHITTLSTALYFLLKRLKVKPAVSLAAVSFVTLLYCALCSFTASALRAFVMSGVFNAASSFGKKRDNLSALSLAAILILTFRPTALFEAGFLLSFSSMLGIFLFGKTFSDVGMKVVKKLSPERQRGKRIVELLSATLSASLMSYPFVAYFFGYMPALQILSNIIFVPYMMAVYVVLLAVSVFALVTTLHPTVTVMRFLLFPFKKYVLWAGDILFSHIFLPTITVPAMVLYLLIALFVSRYNLMPSRDKSRGAVIAITSSVALCLAIALI